MVYPSMIAYHRQWILRRFCISLLLLTFGTHSLFATWDGYLGASASVSQWQMGFASGKNTQLFGQTMQSNKPDPLLFMAGLSASIVYNKTWALTYQGELGKAQPQVTFSNTDLSSGMPETGTMVSDANILRIDHSVALSRTLGLTGLNFFIGGKLQTFGYDQGSGSYTLVSGGTVTQTAVFAMKQNLTSFGPALGINYTFHVYQKIFGAIQAGFIYFPGQYTATMRVNLVSPSPQVLYNQVDEKFYGLGFTGLISIIVPLQQTLFLQISGRAQYYYSRTREGTSTNQTTSKTTTAPSATMDNVLDGLLGGQVAVICRLF